MAASRGAEAATAQPFVAERAHAASAPRWRSLLVPAAIAAFRAAARFPDRPGRRRDLMSPSPTADGALHAGSLPRLLLDELMRESFWNSIYVAAMTRRAGEPVIAVPLAYLTTRFEFRGATLIQTLGVLPLIMPPFVGAVAMQLLFGRNGTRQPAARATGSISSIPVHGGAQRRHLRAGDALLSRSSCSTSRPRCEHRLARWRKRRRTSARTACACSGASCFRWRCPATSPAPPGVRQGVRRSRRRRCCSTSDQHAGAAGLSAHHARSVSTIRWAT